MMIKDVINELIEIYNKDGNIPVKYYSGNVCSYNDLDINEIQAVVSYGSEDKQKSWNFKSGEKFCCIGEFLGEFK
jgi:hypothetical protein